MTDPPPPYRPRSPSKSEFDSLAARVAKVEETGSHKVYSIPPTWSELTRRTLWHALRWMMYTKGGTAVSLALGAAIVALLQKLTHFLDVLGR